MTADPRWSTADDVYDAARSWRYRVLRASIGTTTGAIVMAILGQRSKLGPAFGLNCDINMHGVIITDVRGPDGKWNWRRAIGTVEAVRDNIRRLADHCKLNDEDRTAMFEELRKWVRKDERALAQGLESRD